MGRVWFRIVLTLEKGQKVRASTKNKVLVGYRGE